MAKPALQPDKFMQVGMRFARGKIEIFAAAFGVESKFYGNRFQQGGFAGAILTNEKSDGGMKLQPLEMLDGWHAKRVFVKAFHRVTFKPDRVEE